MSNYDIIMSKWIYTFDIKDDWRKAYNKEISAKKFAEVIVEKIKNAVFYSEKDNGLNDIIRDFQDLREHDDFDDFDTVWDDFYNWADKNRVWVRTC